MRVHGFILLVGFVFPIFLVFSILICYVLLVCLGFFFCFCFVWFFICFVLCLVSNVPCVSGLFILGCPHSGFLIKSLTVLKGYNLNPLIEKGQMTNNDLQNITQKSNDRNKANPTKSGVNFVFKLGVFIRTISTTIDYLRG